MTSNHLSIRGRIPVVRRSIVVGMRYDKKVGRRPKMRKAKNEGTTGLF